MIDPALLARADALLALCRARGLTLATAESCTGGLVAATLTAIAGASDVVERGFITYSNDAKIDCLGVPEMLIRLRGAVSAEVARAMAEGLLARSPADLGLSVTGVAGPGGGTAEKPVGLVYIATARRRGMTAVEACRFDGDRAAIRHRSLAHGLEMLRRAALETSAVPGTRGPGTRG